MTLTYCIRARARYNALKPIELINQRNINNLEIFFIVSLENDLGEYRRICPLLEVNLAPPPLKNIGRPLPDQKEVLNI